MLHQLPLASRIWDCLHYVAVEKDVNFQNVYFITLKDKVDGACRNDFETEKISGFYARYNYCKE